MPGPVCANVRGLSLTLIPKNANTAMRVAVLEGIGVDRPEQRRHTALALGAPTGFVATFFRDPVERAVSCWADKLCREAAGTRGLCDHGFRVGMSFGEFVEHLTVARDGDVHTRAQHLLTPPPDYAGRVERLAEDWERLRRRFGWLAPLRVRNAAPRPDVNPEPYRAAIRRLYREDVELWERA